MMIAPAFLLTQVDHLGHDVCNPRFTLLDWSTSRRNRWSTSPEYAPKDQSGSRETKAQGRNPSRGTSHVHSTIAALDHASVSNSLHLSEVFRRRSRQLPRSSGRDGFLRGTRDHPDERERVSRRITEAAPARLERPAAGQHQTGHAARAAPAMRFWRPST